MPVLLAEASRLFDANADEERARERGVETLLLVERLLGEETAQKLAAEDSSSTGIPSRSSTPVLTPKAA